MAKWQDLPLELKEKIIDMVDNKGNVRAGVPYGSRAARATLCALSLVSREAWQLAARVLWQTLKVDSRSAQRLRSWREILSRVAPFVRSTNWMTPSVRIEIELGIDDMLSTFLHTAPSFSKLVTLEIPAEGRWSEIVSALPLSVREQIKDLKIDRGPPSLNAAILVQGFPFVKALHLALLSGENNDDGASALVATIQSLCCLETFVCWRCTFPNHPSLSNKWQGPLLRYDSWTVRMPMSLVRGLLVTLGDTLQVFKAGLTTSSKAVKPLPVLPLLHTAEFALNPAMSSTLSTLLSTLHLHDLKLIYNFDEPDEQLDFDTIAPFLQAEAATLKSLSIWHDLHMGSAELVSDEDRKKLDALAEGKGVELWVDQVVYSDEEED